MIQQVKLFSKPEIIVLISELFHSKHFATGTANVVAEIARPFNVSSPKLAKLE